MSGRFLVLSALVFGAFALQSQKRDFTNGDVTIYGPSTDYRTQAPTINGYTPYDDTFSFRYQGPESPHKWVGLDNSNLGFTDFPFIDITNTDQGGWRLGNETDSEVVFKLADNYADAFNCSITVGNQTGSAEYFNNAALTYLNTTAAPALRSREVVWGGNFTSQPFASQVISLSKHNTYKASGCSESWNFTATTTDATNTTRTTSGVDGLTLNVPTALPATVVLKNAFDPGFEATLYYSGVLPYLSVKGSSSQIGNISLTQVFSIEFCPDDD
ncbi:hypothetical protein FIBSPDRAFT_870483 [Athelia psychrophila]|uniref:Agglutinin-like protein N-terminal domain-containing protein n=1 Tax=Athelia psychrophila TaxID=1759441 RepID=A0A166B0V2_9AGAM|nr:hypothetical protein FIBSPDRAFT_870483 [Fibularhizoctonia sp. CBS 109695]